jgi:hypothetical protein
MVCGTALFMSTDKPAIVTFSQKPRPVGFQIEYTLEGPVLTVDSTRKIDTVNLATVEQVRFLFQPSTISNKGYKTKLTLRDGKVLTFGNLSWRSMVDLDKQEEPYRRFATAVATEVAKAAPQARFVAGKPAWLWALFALVSAGAALAMVGFSVTAFMRGQNNAGLLGLFMTSLAIWQLKPMVMLNRPRYLPRGQVPPELLP